MEKLTEQQKLEQRRLGPVNKAAFRFMVGLATVLFKKKYGVSFTYADDIRPYRGKPYIVVSNHASRVDYVFTAPAFWPDTFNFVVGYNEFFRSHLAGVLRAMQTVPKKNFVQQPYSIRQMIRIIRGGGRIIILPEGMSSISGANQPCALGSGHLLKSLKVPVLYTKIAGGYLTAPKFDLEDRPGRVDVTVGVLFTPEQLAQMSAEEIQAALDEKLYHDDYEWNKKARVKFDGKGRMAKNLHQLLFWCPKCGGELCMASEGDRIYCKNCGNAASLNEYYDLLPEEGSVIPETPRVWFDMQREHVKARVAQPGFELRERVKLGTLPEEGFLKDQATSEITGEGELRRAEARPRGAALRWDEGRRALPLRHPQPPAADLRHVYGCLAFLHLRGRGVLRVLSRAGVRRALDARHGGASPLKRRTLAGLPPEARLRG